MSSTVRCAISPGGSSGSTSSGSTSSAGASVATGGGAAAGELRNRPSDVYGLRPDVSV